MVALAADWREQFHTADLHDLLFKVFLALHCEASLPFALHANSTKLFNALCHRNQIQQVANLLALKRAIKSGQDY